MHINPEDNSDPRYNSDIDPQPQATRWLKSNSNLSLVFPSLWGYFRNLGQFGRKIRRDCWSVEIPVSDRQDVTKSKTQSAFFSRVGQRGQTRNAILFVRATISPPRSNDNVHNGSTSWYSPHEKRSCVIRSFASTMHRRVACIGKRAIAGRPPPSIIMRLANLNR